MTAWENYYFKRGKFALECNLRSPNLLKLGFKELQIGWMWVDADPSTDTVRYVYVR